MQGRLRSEQLSITIDTQCVHCDQPLHLTLDSELVWSIKEQDASPLVFEPDVAWGQFTGANIIADY